MVLIQVACTVVPAITADDTPDAKTFKFRQQVT